MKSKLPKALQPVSGETMLQHVIDAASEIGSNRIVCVVGHGKEHVMEALAGQEIEFVEQKEQLGTGHAAKMARSFFTEGSVLILYGDTPLLTAKTLRDFMDLHHREGNTASLITAIQPDPTGFGRIVRDEQGAFLRIVEERDASIAEKKIVEVNSGVGMYDAVALGEKLDRLSNDNDQKEYMLTDVFEMILADGGTVGAYPIEDATEMMGVNDRYQLMKAEAIHQDRIKKALLYSGVTIHMPETVFIHKDVQVGENTTIHPGTRLMGHTVIGSGCEIGPNTDLTDCEVGDDVVIQHSVLLSSKVANRAVIGPFAYVRPGCEIGEGAKVGDFVELKNTKVGAKSKIPHLTYAGDGEIGERVNIGCGTIFVNYDGNKKSLTRIGDDSFIGCNSNLVAPIRVGSQTFVAAGSTLTQDVPDRHFAVARAKQENRPNKRVEESHE